MHFDNCARQETRDLRHANQVRAAKITRMYNRAFLYDGYMIYRLLMCVYTRVHFNLPR